MRERHLLFHLVALLALPLASSAQTIEWVRQFGSGSGTTAEADGVAVDSTGIYVVGRVSAALPGQTSAGGQDAFIRKYDARGNELWTRQFGSDGDDAAWWVAVDATGVYLTGQAGGALPGQTNAGGLDAYVRKYDLNGNELWTRQFGTPPRDEGGRVAVDSTGVYVVGLAGEALPGQTSAGGSDAYARKYDLNGNELWTRQFGSPAGEAANSIAVDATGLYVGGTTLGILPGQTGVGGRDAFLRKYDADGNTLWTRQFGSVGPDNAWGLAATGTGVYVTGFSGAGQTGGGGSDVFVRKFDANGSELWIRQFGTAGNDVGEAVAADAIGFYLAGDAGGALPGQTFFGAGDAFLRRYDANGTEQWTLQFGSANNDQAFAMAVGAAGVYLVGPTGGALPGQTNSGGIDAYVAKIVPPLGPPAVSDGGVVNSATYAAPVAPGSLAAVFGSNLNDGSSALFTSLGADGKVVTTLGGASVKINNIAAPMFYSTTGQIGIQIPFELAGQTSATIQVTVGSQTSPVKNIVVDSFAPGVFTLNQQGTGIAAVLHQDGVNPVTERSPARPGEVLVFFGTGLGGVTPVLVTGAPSTGNRTDTLATVTVDGVQAVVGYSGMAPGFVGLNQINVTIPSSTRAAANVPVILTIGGKQSNTVTIPVSQ